jgi:hypothetical protein
MTILIPIISEFQGKGFKEAQKQTSALDKGLKRLAVTLGTALSIRKITQFSKAAVRAFSEEDRAVQALAMNLKNLGIAYDVRPVEDYISKLQYATGVADGELRPALQQLLTTTGNLAKSQEILNLALDIAAGSGKSLGSVTQALSRAYLGNNTSLLRLNIGLSKAYLSSKSFNEVTEDLTKRFSGQASRAAQTYAGQMAILSVAAEDAQETIGKGLVQALQLLGAEDGIQRSATAMQNLARFSADAALASAYAVSRLQASESGWIDLPKRLWLFAWQPFLDDVREGAAAARAELLGMNPAQRISPRVSEMESAIAIKNWRKQQREIEKARKEQERIAKAAKLAREETERRRKILEKLNKAGDILDTEKASIEAALKNESLSENEILRLKLKKALLNENADKALELADKLGESQAELAKISSFKPANPFQEWEDSLARIRAGMASIGAPVASITTQGTVSGQMPLVPSVVPQGQSGFIAPSITQDVLDDVFGRGAVQAPATININVTGTGDLSDDTKKKIVDTIIDYSSIGYSTSGWYRTTGNIAL